MIILNKEQIMEIIPHRAPFLLVDEVTYLDMELLHTKAKKYVDENEYYFQGHFPGNPIMPGVLILESLAQTGAISILNKSDNKGKIALFARSNNVRFKGIVKPGDVLELETIMRKMKAGICICDAVATVNGEVVCSAEITCAVK